MTTGEMRRRCQYSEHQPAQPAFMGVTYMRLKTTLTLGVASVAVAVSVAQPAQAACSTLGTTVTCAAPGDTVTNAETQLATISAGPDSNATFINQVGSILDNGAATTLDLNQDSELNLAYVFSNAGSIGTLANSVEVHYDAVDDTAGNSFTFGNTGNIFGDVYIHNVTDFITATNGGMIAGSLYAGTNGNTEGPVSITNTGTVGGEITAQSQEGNATVVTDGDVGVDGSWGDVNAYSNGSVAGGAGPVVVNATTSTYEETHTALGGTASVTIGDGATVGDVTAEGLVGAVVTVNGSVGDDDDSHNVYAASFGEDTTFNSTTISNNDGSPGPDNASYNETYTASDVGGNASVVVNEGGSVFGDVEANADDDASVNNAGFIGGGDISVFAEGEDYTSTFGEDFTRATSGTVDTVVYGEDWSESYTTTGGMATLVNTGAIGDGDNPSTSIDLYGNAGASLTNSGTITNNGDIDVRAGGGTFGEDGFFSVTTVTDTAVPTVLSTTFSVGEDTSFTNAAADASLVNDADGEIFADDIDVYANGNASLDNAGFIGAFDGAGLEIDVVATGEDFAFSFGEDTTATPTTYSRIIDYSFTSTSVGGEASFVNTGLIGVDQYANVQIYVAGDAGATVDNTARINGDIEARSGGYDYSFTGNSTYSSSPTGYNSSLGEDFTFSTTAADTTFTNASTGLIVGDVELHATGDVVVNNPGKVTGYIKSYAEGEDYSTSVAVGEDYVEAGALPVSFGEDFTLSYSNETTGGDVTGTYSGSVGSVQFAAQNSDYGDVVQVADGNSEATVTGLVLGGFTGIAGGEILGEDYSWTRDIAYNAAGDPTTDAYTQSYGEDFESKAGDSTLAVNGGSIGTETGDDAYLEATGDASALIGNGGHIEGGLTLFGGSSSASWSDTFTLNDTTTNTYDAGTSFITMSDRSVSWDGEYTETDSDGAASVVIGDGTVGGNVYASSAKGGTTFTLSDEGEVGGSVDLRSYASDYTNTWTGTFDSVDLYDATPTLTSTTATSAYSYEWTSTSMGGDVTAVVDGVIGNDLNGPKGYGAVSYTGGDDDLNLESNGGAVMATVTGQVHGDISLYSAGEESTGYGNFTYSDAYVGYGEDYASTGGTLTSSISGEDLTHTTGTANLVIDAADTSVPVNYGDITVEAVESASLTIAAGNMVVNQTDYYGEVYVGSLFHNTTYEYVPDVLAPGDSTTTWTTTHVGGPATLVNNGIIGYDGGPDFDGRHVEVVVESISDATATATNTGLIYGSLTLSALATDTTQVTVIENANDPTELDTTTRTYTPVGGTALLTNSGLIADWAEVRAENGTVNNTGVIRDGIYLGEYLDNYETVQLDTLVLEGPEVVTPGTTVPFLQTYTVNQNGFLGGGVSVAGAFGNIDPTVQTSIIDATINLNNGSVTTGTIQGEFDEETGARYTMTDVNLNGGGYLGLTWYDAQGYDFFGEDAANPLVDQFSGIDPQMAYYDDLNFNGYSSSRVIGVENLTKTGAGTFYIYGEDHASASNTNDFADYTVDVGTFAIQEGEIQLAVAGGEDGIFSIRGNLMNDATLVLGRRVTAPDDLFASNVVNQGLDAIAGLQVYQLGDFTQSETGTLVVGQVPSLMRYYNPTVGTGYTTNEPLGVAGSSVSLGYFTTPERAFGNLFGEDSYYFQDSFVTLDGNLELHGTVELVGPGGGIYLDGETQDIFSVSGDVIADADVEGSPNNFVSFTLGQREEADRTIVYVGANRAGYETVGLNDNAIAAGVAMTNSVPYVVNLLTADGPYSSVEQFGLVQDMATIIAGFDTVLTLDQVSQALNELASGNFYGSLSAIRTTDPFVDVVSNRRIPEGATGFNLWLQPSGDFYRLDKSYDVGDSGAVDLDADNYGGSAGFGVATGNGEFGLGFGYGHIDASSDTQPVNANGDTWMVGIYARQAFGPLTIAADLVHGWTSWDAERGLPTLARSATSKFDSKELRGDLRVEYAFPVGENAFVAPYGQIELRNFKFDGFTEEGAGAVNLIVEKSSKTLFTPTLGVKFGTGFDAGGTWLRPEATLSYSFGDYQTDRDVAYAGNPNEVFRLQGVDPSGFFTGTLGLFADIGSNSGAFIRGSYATGGDGSVAGLKAGVVIGFGSSAPAPLAAPPAPVAAPPPPPPPAPEVACNKGPYIVFFDWDRSDITPEAGTILDSAVTAYGNCDVVPIMLAGYTDRSGSNQYNLGLSARRNSSVRDYLTTRGIPSDRITGQAFGEANPRVPTADGVRELQNRRVEITYGPGSGM